MGTQLMDQNSIALGTVQIIINYQVAPYRQEHKFVEVE